MSVVTRIRHRFQVADYERMVAEGILNEEDRCELIRGEIVEKMTIGDRHAACVKRLNQILSRLAGERAIVSVQDPIRLADSVPEPDIALLRPRADFYAEGKPGPDEVLLVIEVADASLAYDRAVKVPLYAENGIVECWLVDLNDKSVEVHRRPSGESYSEVQTIDRRGVLELPEGLGTIRIDEIV
jgi:hypothetical protein